MIGRVKQLFLLTLALVLAAPAGAKPQPPTSPPGPPGHMGPKQPPPPSTIYKDPSIVAYLKLTPEQIQGLKAIDRTARAEVQKLHTQLRREHQGMRKAFTVHPPDQRAALISAAAIGQLLARQVTLDATARLKAHNLLTSQQVYKLGQLVRVRRGPPHRPTGPFPGR